MAPKRKAGKRRNYHGLFARNFPKDRRWAVDFDYLDKLSPQEKEWLATFSDGHYGGDFRADPDTWTTERRRDVVRDKHASQHDILTLASLADGISEINETTSQVEADPKDWSPSPAYLDGDDYKEARAEFRKHLMAGRRAREPYASSDLEKARRRLLAHTPPTDDLNTEPT